jgi:hypothetical protein
VPPLTSEVRRSRLLDFPHQPGIKQRMRHTRRLRQRAELRLLTIRHLPAVVPEPRQRLA